MANVYLWQVDNLGYQGHPVFGILEGEDAENAGLVSLIYMPDAEIDGHWLARITGKENPKKFDPIHDEVIGITSHYDRINVKLYQSARGYAENYAIERGFELKDETLPGSVRHFKVRKD